MEAAVPMATHLHINVRTSLTTSEKQHVTDNRNFGGAPGRRGGAHLLS